MFKLFTSWIPRGLYLSPSVLVNCRDHTEELVKFFDIKGRAFQLTKKNIKKSNANMKNKLKVFQYEKNGRCFLQVDRTYRVDQSPQYE